MPRTVACPRCGAENPDSLIITVCKGCGGSLAGAKPTGTPPSPPVPLAPARPTVPAPPRREVARRDEAAPTSRPAPPPRAAKQEPLPENAERAFCDHCGTRNEPGSAWCARCGHRLEQRADARPQPQRTCPRCGRSQAHHRRSCEYCGMHFVGAEADSLAPLSRRDAGGGRNEAQRAAMMVLGCVWLGFGLLIALLVVLALANR